MSDLGALLRKAREQHGLTLDDIQESTKIRKRYLEAIESGDYKVLPGSFYVRAFVKTYAETVGLDAEEVLRLYHKELPKAPAPETSANEPIARPVRRRSVQHNDRLGKVAVTLLMWAFPILIAVVIYIYYANNAGKAPEELDPGGMSTEIASPTPSATPSDSIPIATPTPLPTPTPTPEPVTLTFEGVRQSINRYTVSPGTGSKVTIDITGRSWVGVNENGPNGKMLFNGTPEEPQKLTYELTVPLYVNVGRSDQVTVSVDGVAVDDGDKAGSTKFLFTPESALEP